MPVTVAVAVGGTVALAAPSKEGEALSVPRALAEALLLGSCGEAVPGSKGVGEGSAVAEAAAASEAEAEAKKGVVLGSEDELKELLAVGARLLTVGEGVPGSAVPEPPPSPPLALEGEGWELCDGARVAVGRAGVGVAGAGVSVPSAGEKEDEGVSEAIPPLLVARAVCEALPVPLAAANVAVPPRSSEGLAVVHAVPPPCAEAEASVLPLAEMQAVGGAVAEGEPVLGCEAVHAEVPLGVFEAGALALCCAVGTGEALAHVLGVAVGLPETVTQLLAEEVWHAVAEGVPLLHGDAEAVPLSPSSGDAVGEAVVAMLPLGLAEGVGLPVWVRDSRGEGEPQADAVRERGGELVADVVAVAHGEALPSARVGLEDALAQAESVALLSTDGVVWGEALLLLLPQALREPAAEEDTEGEEEGEGVAEGQLVPDRVAAALRLSVPLGEGVPEDLLLRLKEAEAVGVAELLP